jgi:hypothetical protein
MLVRVIEFMREIDYAAFASAAGWFLFIWTVFAMFVGYIFNGIDW